MERWSLPMASGGTWRRAALASGQVRWWNRLEDAGPSPSHLQDVVDSWALWAEGGQIAEFKFLVKTRGGNPQG